VLTANQLDGKRLAEQRLGSLRETVRDHDLHPSLHVIFVGDNEASESYIGMKEKKAESVGIGTQVHRFPADAPEINVIETIRTLNDDSDVDGIIVQLPLPDSFDELKLLESVAPTKDVDGLHPVNFGKLLGGGEPHFFPPTPKGIMTLLDDYDVDLKGSVVTLVGMGRLIGRPISQMFQNRHSTVLCLNKHTSELADFTRQADVIVVGTGQPELIKEEHVTPGTVVVDAGIHRLDGELVGDVDFDEVAEVAGLITPVPGGVGPLTVAGLLENTVKSARQSI
jgi:methylenetetrahydrofolate dehydrogenase (NADP+)/methenyltetrahydrofolate cyclohydrolase